METAEDLFTLLASTIRMWTAHHKGRGTPAVHCSFDDAELMKTERSPFSRVAEVT
jgi:hypothetical protein